MRRLEKSSSISKVVTAIILAVFLGTASSTWATEAKPITFSGKVIDSNNQPIQGAKVSAYEFTEGALNGTFKVRLLEEATTGPDGTFSFKADSGPVHAETTLVARKPGLAMGWALHPTRDTDKQRDIILGQPKQMSGVVVDANNKPLDGATVFVTSGTFGESEDVSRLLIGPLACRLLTAQTDTQGRFAINDLPDDATFELGVRKPGYGTITTIDRTRMGRRNQYAAEQTDIKLVLRVEARIEGVIVERGSGKPVEGIPVVLRGESLTPYWQPAPVTSQAGGVFRFDAIPPDAYVLSVGTPWGRAAEWVTESPIISLKAGEVKRDVRLEISRGALLEVLVKSGTGDKPIRDATISLRPDQASRWISTASDANGVARLRLTPGTYRLDPYAKGYARSQQQTVALADGQTHRVTVVLNETPQVTGVVRDGEGKPVSGAALSIMPGNQGEVVSDQYGKFTVLWDPLWGGRDATFCLLARHIERNLAAVAEIAKDTRTLDVNVVAGVILTGKVTDPNGKGISGAHMRMMLQIGNWGSPLGRGTLQTEADGHFQITGIPVNQKYDLNTNAGGYGSNRTRVETEAPPENRLDVGAITLQPAHLSIRGQVVDPAGHPVPHATLDGYGTNQPEALRAEADSEGRFVFEHVCAGLVTLRTTVAREGKSLSARVTTDGGASGIQIMLHEGEQAATQYIGTRTYEQILAGADKAIAGIVVDESGKPVTGVPVGVCCQIRVRPGDTRKSWMFSSFENLKATTDQKGRFAIALEEEAEYNLLFSPDKYAATIVYDVPFNTRNVKVALETGGVLDGRLLRLEKGQKVPVANAEVKLEQADRSSYTHLGFDRDRTTVTDAQGRFHFEHIQTKVRPFDSRSEKQWNPVPRGWNLAYGQANASVLFTDTDKIENFEFLIKPNLEQALSLVGRPLPSLDDLKTGVSADQLKGKAILVCFFDFQQRPARNTVLQLAKRADELKAKDMVIVAVEISNVTKDTLDPWIQQNNVSIPIGVLGAEAEEIRFAWAAKALPWLVLADTNHLVTAEGFGVDALDSKIQEKRR
jgi:protocatechuate 3,4-dioxygenase beta subunit